MDVKILIALIDEDVWIKLISIDNEFKQYAYRKEGKKLFVEKFTKKENNKTHLFDKLHSIYDEPAENYASGNKYWYYHGERHRENDLSAIIFC